MARIALVYFVVFLPYTMTLDRCIVYDTDNVNDWEIEKINAMTHVSPSEDERKASLFLRKYAILQPVGEKRSYLLNQTSVF